MVLCVLIVPNLAKSYKFKIVEANYESLDKIASYVGKVISDFNNQSEKNCNDVALIKFQQYSDDIFYEKIIAKIPKENVMLMPQLGKNITSQRIRTTAFVIIVADNFEVVS